LIWIVIRARAGQSRGSDYSKASSDAELSMQFEQALSVFKLEMAPFFSTARAAASIRPPLGIVVPKEDKNPRLLLLGLGRKICGAAHVDVQAKKWGSKLRSDEPRGAHLRYRRARSDPPSLRYGAAGAPYLEEAER